VNQVEPNYINIYKKSLYKFADSLRQQAYAILFSTYFNY